MSTNFFCTDFLNTPKAPGDPCKIPGHPRFLPSKPNEHKPSREGTNFSSPTPSRGRPPPHPTVSGPKKLMFVLFFLARTLGASLPQTDEEIGPHIQRIPNMTSEPLFRVLGGGCLGRGMFVSHPRNHENHGIHEMNI